MLKRLLQLAGLAAFAVIAGFVVFVVHITTAKPYEGIAEGIVVLTGGEGRVEAGLQLLAEHKGERLLISGAHKDVSAAALQHFKNYSNELEPRIDLGKTAFDTLGNADETKDWVEQHHIQSIIVVTAHYHMPRALLHLGSELPDVALYPYPVKATLFDNPLWYRDKAAWNVLVSDYTKLLFTYPQILFIRT